MKISVSRLRSYLLCSKQYEYRYELNLPPEFTSVNLAFGSAMHHSIAEYHQSLNTISTDEMFAEFNKYWRAVIEESEGAQREIRFKSESEETLLEKAQGLCAQYIQVFGDVVPKSPDDVEVLFEVPLFDPTSGLGSLQHSLSGKIDLVADNTIYEFKTSSRSASQKDADTSIQLTAYALAFEYLYDAPPEALKLVTLATTKEPKISIIQTQRWHKDYQCFVEMGIQVARAIESGIFFRNREYQYGCYNCEHEGKCLGFQMQMAGEEARRRQHDSHLRPLRSSPP